MNQHPASGATPSRRRRPARQHSTGSSTVPSSASITSASLRRQLGLLPLRSALTPAASVATTIQENSTGVLLSNDESNYSDIGSSDEDEGNEELVLSGDEEEVEAKLQALASVLQDEIKKAKVVVEKRSGEQVQELEGKSCWICMEDDTDSPGKTWVHPCTCTLLAHESCLLVWVASQQQSGGSASKSVACPQCKSQYSIIENKEGLIKVFDTVDGFFSDLRSMFIIGTISSSLLSTSTLLGFSTLRLFLGSQSTLTLLGNRGPAGWPLWSWLILPVVPYVQIGHAFAIDILGLEKWSVLERSLFLAPFFLLPRPAPNSPFSLSLPSSSTYVPSFFPSSSGSSSSQFFSITPLTFPPSPGLTLALLPLASIGYNKLKRKMRHWMSRSEGVEWGFGGGANGRRERTVLQEVLGEVGGVQIGLVDARPDAPPTVPAPVANGPADPLQNPHPESLYLTRTSVSRLAVGALLFPPFANLTGQALRIFARWTGSRTFRWLIGAGVGKVGLSGGGGQGIFGGRNWKYLEKGGPDGGGAPWWTTAIGGMVFTLLQDGVSHIHRYLRMQQRKTRRIANRPLGPLQV